MTQRQSLVSILAQVLVAVLALTGATVLCGMGRLESESLVVLYTAALTLASGGAAATARAAINGGPRPDYRELAGQSPEAATILARSVGHHEPTATARRENES